MTQYTPVKLTISELNALLDKADIVEWGPDDGVIMSGHALYEGPKECCLEFTMIGGEDGDVGYVFYADSLITITGNVVTLQGPDSEPLEIRLFCKVPFVHPRYTGDTE